MQYSLEFFNIKKEKQWDLDKLSRALQSDKGAHRVPFLRALQAKLASQAEWYRSVQEDLSADLHWGQFMEDLQQAGLDFFGKPNKAPCKDENM